jgi:transposase
LTGGKARFFGISKRGNSYLRKILVYGVRQLTQKPTRQQISKRNDHNVVC